VAVFITGSLDVAAMAAAAGGAGIGLLLGRPARAPGWWPILLSSLFAAAAASALIPSGGHLPVWRLGAPETVRMAGSFAAMPAHLLFWWGALAATILTGWFLLASPLDTRSLRIFLHAVAGIVAAYAIVCIVQAHTAWTYPFSGGANFGLLPNRNHTASLLVVGSVVSFGLMQWEVVHHHRAGAVMSALWGAPSLAALLFFSTSRAGVVFLAVGFMLWAAGAGGQAVKRRTALSAGVILAGFLTVLLVTGGSTVRDRLGALWHDAMAAGEEAGPIDFREPVFRDTWKMIQDAPLTGQGLGHFEFVFPHYREVSRTASLALHPESDWLMVAAESGLPALLVLLLLAGWYLARCWGSRRESGGLLRWTVASAIGAVLAHGIVDVPWHRPASGWFFLVVALATVPPGRNALQWPRLWRAAQCLLGLVLFATALWLVRAGTTDRPPLAYRWPGYAAELKDLLEARKYDDGEFVAREAIRDFPLNHQAYYWRAGFLRMFEGTEKEMEADTAAGRFVEPVLPSVAAEQALLWEGISNDQVVEARAEAVRRAGLIDRRTGGGSAADQLDRALQAMQNQPVMQNALRERVAADPTLLAHWLRRADAPLVEEYFAGLGPGLDGLLTRLPAESRTSVLERWITLPSAPAAAAYMEARNVPSPGPYWRQLATYYATAGDKPRAVATVAGAEGFSLQGGLPPGELARQLTELQAQGNSVAVRRLVREATEAVQPDPDNLRLAVIWYAGAGDWEMAWKAASRLATTRKKGQ
jgi:O-antigen ligase